jgi:hypothetical protein
MRGFVVGPSPHAKLFPSLPLQPLNGRRRRLEKAVIVWLAGDGVFVRLHQGHSARVLVLRKAEKCHSGTRPAASKYYLLTV